MNLQKYISQQDNPYYFAYHMVISSMQHNNVYNGISKSLLLAKVYLQCDDIILYKLNEENHYEQFNSTPYLINNYEQIIDLLNARDNEIREHKWLDFEVSERNIHRLTILPIDFKDYNYRIVIINNKITDLDKNEKFLHIINKSFKVILDQMETYHQMIKLSNQDGLTGLDNRMSYIAKIDELDQVKQHVTFVYLDLFCLKNINDMYGHQIGDLYIAKTADILKNYFPNYTFKSDAYATSQIIETGDNVYRIGGDEFVILSINKTTEQIEEIIMDVVNDVKKIGLDIKDNPITSINYGISERCNLETMSELYKLADEKLSIDKTKTYQSLGIERRKMYI